ncbi:MAG: tetratricopeptide repeat protein, partial [Paracoccaceae bacterium]
AQGRQGGGAVAARLEALEAEIRRLNGRIEELEFRLRRVAEDGGLRLSDLDFRVTELEDGDLSLLGAPTPLGQSPGTGGGTAAPSGEPTPESDRVALADARALLDAGDPDAARGRLLALLSAAPDGPLTSEAEYWLGMSEMALGDARGAAQTFLTTIDAYPDGPRAAESLLMLGRALEALGATGEACDTFEEVAARHPAHPAAVEAEAERDDLACP